MKLFKRHLLLQKGFALSLSKGFTLIELLIVIAILGILAAGVLVAINPVKRINQAKDSIIKSDIGQVATAMQTYYAAKGTTGSAYYPSTVAGLVPDEIKAEPKVNGNSYNMNISPATCTTAAGDCVEISVYYALNDPATAGNVWCWRSSTGVTAEVAAAACTAP